MSGSDRDAIRVLLVDDEPQFAALAARRLEEHGDIDVSTERTPRAALDRLEELDADCVVSDYGMPDMNGLEFLETVRAENPDLPFIILTARGSEEVASKAISAGVTDYFRKGLGQDQYVLLANRIENAVDRYRTKAALAESEERFKSLIEHSTDVVQVVDESGRITYQSPSVERILGYDPDELVGEDLLSIVHPEDHERVVATLEALTKAAAEGEERRLRGEVRLRHADGSWRWVESIGSSRRGSAVDGYVFNSRDVTGRKRRERELRRSERRFDAVLDDPDTFIHLVDPDGRLRRANRPALDLVDGADHEGEFLWTTPWWNHEDLAEDLREWIRRSAEGEYVRFSTDRFAGDVPVAGTVRPVTDDDGTVETVIVEGRDVSERRRRERVLNDLHDVARELMGAESRLDVVSIVNRAATTVFDFPLAGVRLLSDDGQLVVAGVTDETRETVGSEFPTYSVGEGFFGRTFERGAPAVAEDLREADVAFDYDPIRSAMCLPLGEYGVLSIGSEAVGAFDESDLELANLLATEATAALEKADREAALRRRERELKRQNERLEEFASFVSHDLRNPIEAAYGHLELARTECDSDHLEGLGEMLHRMEELVEDALVMARHGQTVIDPEPVDLGVAVEEAWETAAGGEATLVTDGDLDGIRGDKRQLSQLLENLFRNAAEHGGRRVTVGTLPDGFYVEDDGPGIPEADREDVFDPGVSTDEDGTGLGLAIVNQIADAHGWAVSATAGESGGARFEITGVDR